MERLQVAIDKARAQRGEGGTPQHKSSKPSPAEASPKPAHPNAWDALEEMHVDAKLMRRNRITAYEPGIESAPFDLLRTRMLQQAKHHGWRRIAIVSPHSGCGKSTITANLGFSLSRHHNLLSIVFDFDLRRSGLTRILGQKPPFGMVDVLARKASFTDQARRFGSNVAFGLNPGTKVSDPSELLQSTQTTQILDEITEQYAPDIMLFDMPPLMASDDNFGFLQNVDCALIMIAAEQTPMSQIDVAERQVAELTNVMGIVLNKCRYTSRAHGHEYDYY